MGRSLYCFKCFLDDMFTCLSQYLYGHIVRNHILLDQSAHELIFCLGCCRKTDFDLFKSDFN